MPIAAGAAAVCLSAASLLAGSRAAQSAETATPIQHLVVIFQENVSFDHYFATYPAALNPHSEPPFVANDGTPSVNGLGTLTEGQPEGVLLTDNPTAQQYDQWLKRDQSVPPRPFPGFDLRPGS